MKTIYIATAVKEDGEHIQENAYIDAETALWQAKAMCKDISDHTSWQVSPAIIPIDLYEPGDELPPPPPTDAGHDQNSLSSDE